MINERFNRRNELLRMRQARVQVKGRLIAPSGRDVELVAVANRTKGLIPEAARLSPSCLLHVADCLTNGRLTPGTCMESSKKGKFHCWTSLGELQRTTVPRGSAGSDLARRGEARRLRKDLNKRKLRDDCRAV